MLNIMPLLFHFISAPTPATIHLTSSKAAYVLRIYDEGSAVWIFLFERHTNESHRSCTGQSGSVLEAPPKYILIEHEKVHTFKYVTEVVGDTLSYFSINDNFRVDIEGEHSGEYTVDEYLFCTLKVEAHGNSYITQFGCSISGLAVNETRRYLFGVMTNSCFLFFARMIARGLA